jgi:hypothetical protein
MTHCLWNDDENVHKYHLAGWKHVFMRKEYGGLGVPDLRAKFVSARVLDQEICC